MPRAVVAAALLLCSLSVPAREVPLSQPLFEPTGGTRARIASSTSGYAVAWVRSGPPHLVVARFDEDGHLLGEFVEPIFPSFSASVDIASDGTDYLVAWSCATSALKGQTCMARVLASGEVQRVAPIIGNAVTVASNGDGYLLVVDEAAGPLSDEVRAYPLDRRGARTGAGYLVATGAADPLIASNGSNYLITWQTSRPSGRFGAIATAKGLQSAPVFVGNAVGILGDPPAAVASDGRDYLVMLASDIETTQQQRQTKITSFVLSGSSADVMRVTEVLVAPPLSRNLDLAWGGDGYVATFTGRATDLPEGTASDGWLMTIGSDGRRIGEPARFTGTLPRVDWTAVRRRSGVTTIIFDSATPQFGGRPSPGPVLLHARIDAQATQVRPLTFAEASQYSLDVASRGDEQLAVWTESGRVVFAKTAAHAVGPARPVVIAESGSSPAIAVNGEVLVTWFLPPLPNASAGEIVMMLLDEWGRPLSPVRTIATGVSPADVVATSDGFFATWSDAEGSIRSTRLDRRGFVLDDPATTIATGPRNLSPRVAAIGNRVFVTWQPYSGGCNLIPCGDLYGVAGLTMNTDGTSRSAPVRYGDVVWQGPKPAAAGSGFALFFTGTVTLPGTGMLHAVTLTTTGDTILSRSFGLTPLDDALWDGQRFRLAGRARQAVQLMTLDVNLAVVGNMTLYPPDAHSFPADVPSSPVLSRAAGTDVLIFRRVVLSEPPYDGATRYLMSLLPEATRRRAARQ